MFPFKHFSFPLTFYESPFPILLIFFYPSKYNPFLGSPIPPPPLPLLTKRGEEKWYIEGGGVKYILRNAGSNLTWEVVLKNDISTFFTSYW